MTTSAFNLAERTTAVAEHDACEVIEFLRLDAGRRIDSKQKSQCGQFFTPLSIARLMASMPVFAESAISILDAGAGTGILAGASVAEICRRKKRPRQIRVTAYEIDAVLCEYLADTLRLCAAACERSDVDFEFRTHNQDFLAAALQMSGSELFDAEPGPEFNFAILNPPYFKIGAASSAHRVLRKMGIRTSNIYTGFLAAAIRLLAPGGELVAITPRSFFNGTYFRVFRRFFFQTMRLRRIHIFHARDRAFRDDGVLQENVIVHAVKCLRPAKPVLVTASSDPDDDAMLTRQMPHDEIVQPGDPEMFIRVLPDEAAGQVDRILGQMTSTLPDLGLTVSTGRVVDFRAKEFLAKQPASDTAPLIYPAHLDRCRVNWPKSQGKKPNAIRVTPRTRDLLVPNGYYVLVKRFSAKEERRRVVAAVHDPNRLRCEFVAFENHLNYFHNAGRGLEVNLARGLAAFLNSTILDSYFRQFSGHTQVNATDLRNLKYPCRRDLESLGSRIQGDFPDQDALDALVSEYLLEPAPANSTDPIRTMKRIDEALLILRELGLPRAQLNERSALTLLALLDIKPKTAWHKAKNPLRGITPMMEFFAAHYGKQYAPNTRETVRRQTVHQFLDAGLVVVNPDDPARPTNSPKAVYQIESSALALLRSFNTPAWRKQLGAYLASVQTLRQRYAQERQIARIPVEVAPGQAISLSPGGHNVLVKHVVEEFAPRFAPGGQLLYVGDTDEKLSFFDQPALRALGVEIELHGKMPDVIVHHRAKDWLLLIEAVTSHGPVGPKRHAELKRLFAGSRAGLVFVTAFLDRAAMVGYLNDISWETEVWIADAPTHLIHFNGIRFLGPHSA